MRFTSWLELSADYDEEKSIATDAGLKDGDTLYLAGGTVLCKYDISDRRSPKLLKKTDVAADRTGDPTMDHIRAQSAHATAIADIGKYLVISYRGGGGGVANMADGVIVGSICVVEKQTLEKVKELNFENRVTYITKYRDILIVSLHFHGFYIYKICEDADVLLCIYKHIEIEKPRNTFAREFQNSVVFETEPGKINIAFASYIYGIRVFSYDLENNSLSFCSELNPEAFPDMHDAQTGARNTVFGLTSKGNFVYGGISPGNTRFRENFKNVNWARFDKRGIIYGPHDNLAEAHYHMELPDGDKPAFIGVIAGDPAPSFLCTAGNYLLFNLDKQGLGIARIEKNNMLTYIGRALEDREGRLLTHQLRCDGEFLFASYQMPMPCADKPPVFRMYKIDHAE